MIKTYFVCCKRIFLSLFLLMAISICSAQNPSAKSNFWNHVRFGGGIGLGFNNGGFNTSISPSAIYQFNDQLAAGMALSFNYAKYREARRSAYGGSILSLYNPISFLQISAEFEQLRINNSFENVLVRIEENYWSPALFLGVGYTQQNFTLGMRYDVLYDGDKSIYASAWMPFVRLYF